MPSATQSDNEHADQFAESSPVMKSEAVTHRTSSDSIGIYEAHAERLAAEYEATDPGAYRAGYADLMPSGANRMALDVGAGSGRDASWLASLGFTVIAAEPAARMRSLAQSLHQQDAIRWIDDRLPDLTTVYALGLSFDFILLSAVWQHVAPSDRRRAFRKLATLLKPGGLFVMTLRHGPAPADRPMWKVSSEEVEALAREQGLAISRITREADSLVRPGISWTTMCLSLPDDGTAALPLLRGIIINDDKSSTYKLGLIRAVARVAELTPNLAIPRVDDDLVDVPLGAVALNWVRMYLPLVTLGLPQTPTNRGADGLGFAKSGFRALLQSDISSQELRAGAELAGESGAIVMSAIAEAAKTIVTMPVNFIRYPNSEARVFTAVASRPPKLRGVALDSELLSAFGSVSMPGHVWRAMQRMGVWIEPLLVSEWARLMRRYAERQGVAVPPGVAEAALAWLEPVRSVRMAREAALARIASGLPVKCAWSGRILTAATLDIDHCLPWSAWPCGDLWNLLPTHRTTNQREKRDRLPSARNLAAARMVILDWWKVAWRSNAVLSGRFEREAGMALTLPHTPSDEQIFEALEWRRTRLSQDQQLAEWDGPCDTQLPDSP